MQALRSALIVIGALLLVTVLYTLFTEAERDDGGSKPSGGEHPVSTGGEPKQFDYYVLVLSWSPTYCASDGNDRRNPECDPGSERGFTLHGLWPAYAQGWPEDCRRGERVWVPQNVIDGMRDIMPSKSLVVHEYRSHGTCSGLTPERYFGLARQLYRRVAIPPRLIAESVQSLSPEEIESKFVAANDWLKPDMIEVTCRKRQLSDVRICFDRDLYPRSCGQNERRRACRAPSVTLSPFPSR